MDTAVNNTESLGIYALPNSIALKFCIQKIQLHKYL